MKRIKDYIKLMRMHHCIKNLLVFLPLIFSKRIFEGNLLLNAFVGFVSFSLIASCVYIINDIHDADRDRMHSTKCNRPIASGRVSVKSAYILAGFLGIAAVGVNFSVLSGVTAVCAILLEMLYLVLNVMYSIKLKSLPIVDIAILASGFLIRLFYGSVVTGIEISSLFCLTMLFGSFYLALGKRRNELVKEGTEKRKVLKYYTYGFLDKNMYMCISLAMVFYSLWIIDGSNVSSKMIWTVPLVILICFKYSLNIERDSDGDPIEVLIHDKVLMVMVAVYVAVAGAILYNVI